MSEEKLYAVKNDKGEWYDWSDMEFWPKEACTFVAVGNQEDAEHVADSAAGGHVVTLTDEQKVKMPREVGEELDDYQAEDIDLLDYLHDVIDSEKLRVTRVWMLHDREHRIGILADAYRYGWESEPEAKWYVQTPKEWWEEPDIQEWMHLDTLRGVCSGFNKLSRTAFTRSELKKYHLDSDIFTLVPVENEEVSR